MQVFDGVHGGRVDPSGTRRHHDDEHRALESADALEFLDGQLRARLGCLGGPQPDIDADGFKRVSAEERLQILAGWSRRDEFPSRPAKLVPFDQGGGASGLVGVGRLLALGLDEFVEGLEGGIRRVQRKLEEDAVDDRPEQQSPQ